MFSGNIPMSTMWNLWPCKCIGCGSLSSTLIKNISAIEFSLNLIRWRQRQIFLPSKLGHSLVFTVSASQNMLSWTWSRLGRSAKGGLLNEMLLTVPMKLIPIPDVVTGNLNLFNSWILNSFPAKLYKWKDATLVDYTKNCWGCLACQRKDTRFCQLFPL